MPQTHLCPPRSIRLVAVLLVTATLAACAGRPKPLDPNQTFNVTSVEVLADSTVDAGFAARLERWLEASVGRASRDIGREASLTVRVRNHRTGGGLTFISPSSVAATLELNVHDAADESTLETALVRATAAAPDQQSADLRLMSRLDRHIRSLLGLTGYPRHPVAGIKRAVARPARRPVDPVAEDGVLTDAELLLDPLLNGEVTATSVNLAPEADPEASIDFSKPLLSEAPEPEGAPQPIPAPSSATAEPAEADVTPAPEPEVAATLEPEDKPAVAAAPATDDDEPCIITVDNDCSDPDSR